MMLPWLLPVLAEHICNLVPVAPIFSMHQMPEQRPRALATYCISTLPFFLLLGATNLLTISAFLSWFSRSPAFASRIALKLSSSDRRSIPSCFKLVSFSFRSRDLLRTYINSVNGAYTSAINTTYSARSSFSLSNSFCRAVFSCFNAATWSLRSFCTVEISTCSSSTCFSNFAICVCSSLTWLV